MFGSLRPTALQGCSGSSYQASFCGSCHAMAKTGWLASLATSYDIAFLHEVLAALEKAPTRSLPCTALPFKKVPVRQLSESGQRWLAAVNVLLVEAKCRDDVADEGGWKGRLGLGLLSRRSIWAREVMRETGFAADIVTELPARQAELEAEATRGSTSLEALAMPTSAMLGEVFAHLGVLTQRLEASRALRQLGQSLGAAIYVKDASDDLVKDRSRGRFNAIDVGLAESSAPTLAIAGVMDRELRRAVSGIDRLALAGEGAALKTMVLSLRPPVTSTGGILERWRRRRKSLGILECCCFCVPCDPCSCCCALASEVKKPEPAPPPTPAPKPCLLCPSCGHSMVEALASPFVVIDECTACFGLWLDKGELEAIASASSPIPQRLLSRKRSLRNVQPRPEGTRPCPHCAEFLTVTIINGTRVDLCQGCQGLYLDQGELNELLARD